jgi:hypothetical protein
MIFSTCLSGMTKNSSFLRFRAVFMSYCPQFWGSGWFIRTVTLRTFLRGTTKNWPFCVLGPFLWAIARCFGVHLQGIWQSIHFREEWEKTHHLCVYGRFCELLPTVMGFWGHLQGPLHLVHVWVAWTKTRRFCVLGPFS